MTNPRGKLFATASFCAHAAPVIAGAYRPLHARWRKGGENEERGEKKNWRRRERGRGKIIIFEVDDEATGEETNLSLSVHLSFLSPEPVIRCETSGSSRWQDNREAIARILIFVQDFLSTFFLFVFQGNVEIIIKFRNLL